MRVVLGVVRVEKLEGVYGKYFMEVWVMFGVENCWCGFEGCGGCGVCVVFGGCGRFW